MSTKILFNFCGPVTFMKSFPYSTLQPISFKQCKKNLSPWTEFMFKFLTVISPWIAAAAKKYDAEV